MSTDEIAAGESLATPEAAAPDGVVRRLVGELRARLDEGSAVVDGLVAELARCDETTGQVAGVLRAVVRHAPEALAVVDADLEVRVASPAAAALLGDGGSLHAVLPPGGAFTVRRFLGPAAEAEAEPAAAPGRHGRPQPRRRMTLSGDGVDVTVRRVEPTVGTLGGLWGSPGPAHGLVLFTPAGGAAGAGTGP